MDNIDGPYFCNHWNYFFYFLILRSILTRFSIKKLRKRGTMPGLGGLNIRDAQNSRFWVEKVPGFWVSVSGFVSEIESFYSGENGIFEKFSGFDTHGLSLISFGIFQVSSIFTKYILVGNENAKHWQRNYTN